MLWRKRLKIQVEILLKERIRMISYRDLLSEILQNISKLNE